MCFETRPNANPETVSSNLMNHSPKLILLIVLICSISCKQSTFKYQKNRQVSDENGLPKDSLGFYFSTFEPIDSSQYKFLNDSFRQNYFTTMLYAFKEPILYNDYLGKDRYRFLWLPSFHKPMVFTILNDGGKISLNTKKLDRQPLTEDLRYPENHERDNDYSLIGHELIKEVDTLENGKTEIVTRIKGRFANIIYDSTRILSKGEWEHFEELLTKANFWTVSAFEPSGAADGAFWILEANTRKRYKYIEREMPNDNIMDIGRFLVDLSGLKIKLY